MVKIKSVKVNGIQNGVIDSKPTVSISLEGNKDNVFIKEAQVIINDKAFISKDITNVVCDLEVEPFTTYKFTANVIFSDQTTITKEDFFKTGKVNDNWRGKWISDNQYKFDTPSPKPFHFRKKLNIAKEIANAYVAMTAFGVYEFELNCQKVGDVYFAPGLTSYHNQLQYQVYDIGSTLQNENSIDVYVGGGWAVGSFNYTRANKIYNDRQLLRAEIHIEYTDGTSEQIVTDESWQVSTSCKYQEAEWYDGEMFDGTFDESKEVFKSADISKPRSIGDIKIQYGPQVKHMQTLKPISKWIAPSGEIIFDFGQNFAGVINAKILAKENKTVVFRHAEVLVDDELFVKSLRTAKATATYKCHLGLNQYSPKLTYMGFRYVGVSGIDISDVELEGYVLYSEMETIGHFECSNRLISKLQENIMWGAKSNFVEIPTDCPQRDERQGWTGDIALFSRTANYNYDMSLFYKKWMLDLRSEQGKFGGIPMVVPRAGDKWPVLSTAAWGDSCILIPWNEYLATGNLQVLADNYSTIQKFLKSAQGWSKLFAIGKTNRHIWKYPFHFGDWAAPTGNVKDWIKKGPEIATAYLKNSFDLASNIAKLLGNEKDSIKYQKLSQVTKQAYKDKFFDGAKLKSEFQTAYVLALYFDLFEEEQERKEIAGNLYRLILENGGNLDTGFTGTPYILFALADNGFEKQAYDLLLNESCPSWLYSVKAGGTTIWERWDALRVDGSVNIGDLNNPDSDAEGGGMVSFNHYANGAVGDFFYRRILGIETVSAGYSQINIKPLIGGDLTSASGYTHTNYGKVAVDWKIENDKFLLNVEIPVNSKAIVTLPNGTTKAVNSGLHNLECQL